MGHLRRRIPQRLSQRFVWGGVLFVLVALGGMTLGLWQASHPRSGGERPLEHLGDFGTVPEFVLTERSERRVTRNELLGLVWVTNFFYTTCPDTCPLQSARLARLQRDFADDRDVRLVSISVDPEHDTPEVLRDYAQRFGADPARWLFLTGDKAHIHRLAQEGFRLSVVDPGAAPSQALQAPPVGAPSGPQSQLRSWDRHAHRLALWPLKALLPRVLELRLAWAHSGAEHMPLLHSSRFVLVDRQARIRGYYHSDEEAAWQRLHRDVRTVLREKS
jgi:cytochrome oxidase Cu insertion factor (SCO1/SenC/PrrC family)